jgi:hypothetical protein
MKQSSPLFAPYTTTNVTFLVQVGGQTALDAHDEERIVVHTTSAHQKKTSIMTNEQLAHELLLDKDFRVDAKNDQSDDKFVHLKTCAKFDQAFWDSITRDICRTPPIYSDITHILTFIKGEIEIIATGHVEGRQIAEIIDIELIVQQITQEALDYQGCDALINSIVNVLLAIHDRMRSPMRRKETQDGWSDMRTQMGSATNNAERGQCVSAALKMICCTVQDIRVDSVNKKLDAIVPLINRFGVDYEKRHFERKLEKKTIGLGHTQDWITKTIQELARNPDVRIDMSQVALGTTNAFEDVVYMAVMNLVADTPITETRFPEILLLDFLRIKELHAHMHADVMTAVILVTLEQKCNEVVGTEKTIEIMKSIQHIVLEHPPIPTNPAETLKLVMQELIVWDISTPQLTLMQNMLDKNTAKTSGVYKAMQRVTKRIWFDVITKNNLQTTNPMPEVAKVLLPEIVKHTSSVCTIVSLNLSVHGTRYTKCIQKACRENSM